MATQRFSVFHRGSLVAAIVLALLILNPAAQAQSIWQRMQTPNPNGGDQLTLAISGDSEQDVWVVGDFLSLRFDGQTWSSVPLVFPGGEASMDGVTAISPTDVWAVGSTLLSGTHLNSVIEHYDGTRWTIVSSPQFSTGSKLYKIQAFSANDIFAVGESNSDSQQAQPLVEHYDGNQWSVVPVHLKKGVFNAIAGLSHADFWIAGTTERVAGASGKPVVMHFDGRRFKRVAFPGKKLSIGGIAEIAANDAWIVGSTGSPLTAHWDGNTWTVVPSPSSGTTSGLTGVSAISSTDVWASGSIDDIQQGFLYLIEHWDGQNWTISPIAPTPGGFDALFGTQAFPSGSVFMVGSAVDIGGFEPAVFHTTQGK